MEHTLDELTGALVEARFGVPAWASVDAWLKNQLQAERTCTAQNTNCVDGHQANPDPNNYLTHQTVPAVGTHCVLMLLAPKTTVGCPLVVKLWMRYHSSQPTVTNPKSDFILSTSSTVGNRRTLCSPGRAH